MYTKEKTEGKMFFRNIGTLQRISLRRKIECHLGYSMDLLQEKLLGETLISENQKSGRAIIILKCAGFSIKT